MCFFNHVSYRLNKINSSCFNFVSFLWQVLMCPGTEALCVGEKRRDQPKGLQLSCTTLLKALGF